MQGGTEVADEPGGFLGLSLGVERDEAHEDLLVREAGWPTVRLGDGRVEGVVRLDGAVATCPTRLGSFCSVAEISRPSADGLERRCTDL